MTDILGLSSSGWHADPFGRHHHRYWDGQRWTEYVSDAGAQSIDAPVPSAPPLHHSSQPGRTNGTAIASFVLSLLWIGGIGSLLAVLLGHSARREIRTRNEGGDGFAVAGLILGYLGLVGGVFWIMGLAAATSGPY